MSGEDIDEVRRTLHNIQENIDFINRKYPYLEMELETTTIASPFLEDKTKVDIGWCVIYQERKFYERRRYNR